MSYRNYIPARGDLVHMNFSPSSGHETADRHYALVVSGVRYSRVSRMAIVCAITSRARGWVWEVELPANLLPPKSGMGVVKSVVVADSVRQVDYREREIEFVARAPAAVVEEVLDKLLTVLDED